MRDGQGITVMFIMGLLVIASSVAAFVADRKHVMESCKDVRIAMDGGFSAVVESGGLNPTTQMTVFQEHNRRKIKVDKFDVNPQPNTEGQYSYLGAKLKLVVHNKVQPSTGRQIASLQGEVKGEKVSATLSCNH